MRKSFAGLCRLVETEMGFDLVSGDVFVFVNRRRDRMKMLMWDRSGFVIWYKRLEEGTYEIPDLSGGQGEIGWEDLLLILEEGGFAVGPASQTLCSSTAKYG